MSNGIFVHSDGQIVTSADTVKDAESVSVEFGSEKHIAALVGIDDRTGLALLRIKSAKPLAALDLHNSPQVKAGDTVAVAARTHTNPVSFAQVGVLTAIDINLEADSERSYDTLLQLDFAIHPGGSGAPVVDLSGSLIGVAVAIRSAATNTGFAIPTTEVLMSVNRIRSQAGLPELGSPKVTSLPEVSAPSEAEILTALDESQSQEIPWAFDTKRSNVKVKIEKIADRSGQLRKYLGIGAARIRLCHYKCTVSSDKEIRLTWPIPFTHSEPVTEVVYVERAHLIR